MTQAAREQRLDDIGRGLLDQMQRAECPRCGMADVRPELHPSGIVFECYAPSTRRNKTEDGLCGYRRVVARTMPGDLPAPVFAEKRPVPARRRRTR